MESSPGKTLNNFMLMQTMNHSAQDQHSSLEPKPKSYLNQPSNKSTPNKYSTKKQRFKDIRRKRTINWTNPQTAIAQSHHKSSKSILNSCKKVQSVKGIKKNVLRPSLAINTNTQPSDSYSKKTIDASFVLLRIAQGHNHSCGSVQRYEKSTKAS